MVWTSQSKPASILALLACAAICLAAPAGRALPPIVFTQVPVNARLGGLPDQSARIARLSPDGSVRPLAAEFISAADPDVSFDGKRILFAGKRRAGDKWQIFEMQANGTGIRQITREPMDCRSPAYQSKTYTITVEQPWYQVTFTGTQGNSSSLYSVRLDGSALRRLTYNPFGDMDPYQMADGRIVFAGRQPGRLSLFGINLDGTDFALFSGPEGPSEKRMPCVTSKRLAVFVEPTPVGRPGGTLGSVSLRRNLRSYRQLTRPADGVFFSPSPLADGVILVSRRDKASYGLVRLDPETRRIERVYDDPERHDLQAKGIAPRTEPDGRSSVVDESVPTGKFYCLSVYTGDLANPEWLKPGVAKRLRVVEAVPPDLTRRLLGEFDLDADGSFHIRTPANTPLQFQVLDADGMALRSCTWVWNKNMEQRGCIGCHEDGEMTPENRFAQALAHPAVELTLPPERRRTVEFARDVKPIFKDKCGGAACHASEGLEKAALVRSGSARTSPLVWRIFGRNTARPWDRVPDPGVIRPMPPAGSPPLTAEEKRTIVEWIDLGGKR